MLTWATGFVKDALADMPTSCIAQIFADFNYRLHINPIQKLPFELTEMVMQNVGPMDVIRCSMASKAWRARALDSRLWKMFYFREGWRVDNAILARLTRKAGSRPSRRRLGSSFDAKSSRKRHQSDIRPGSSEDARNWNVQHDTIEADDDRRMSGIESLADGGRSTLADTEGLADFSPSSTAPSSPFEQSGRPSLNENTLRTHENSYAMVPDIKPRMTTTNGSETSPNWLWLYKQRRRMESNWDNGRYHPFQLPKPEHMDEAHDECVYTIQYSGDYLVSGSRDKSIKIWKLSTQRCLQTLTGQHDQSVLCLQFDPAADIIVSGGSDSYVVIWKFSTGEVIKKMTTAHRESVLNLRFDDRYLITCSKDKTIKIWNRKPIMSDDPIVPQMSRAQFAQDPPVLLEPYTLLGTLGGHGAAVNAIQIYKDTIVSASGDRTIRMWNVQTGQCLKDFNGHIKGIACVQFDGRRVVSGSSDNTVRIFDAATKGEVACLQGHTNLVRTVQARFGDMTVTDEEMEQLAQDTQEQWARDLDVMARTAGAGPSRHALDDVDDVRALNTKIPHGGGGSRWSRIVSGSYDETVIIWKKDTNGKWIVNRRLHQDEILANARNRIARQRVPLGHGHGNGHGQGNGHGAAQQANQPGHAGTAPRAIPGQPPAAAPGHHAPRHGGNLAAAAGLAFPGNWPQPAPLQPALHNRRVLIPGLGRPRVAGGAAGMAAPAEENNSNRVFKLQFDARRIVCCSQNRIIVGWDFANGDKDLEEAGQYFAETD